MFILQLFQILCYCWLTSHIHGLFDKLGFGENGDMHRVVLLADHTSLFLRYLLFPNLEHLCVCYLQDRRLTMPS